MTSGRDDGPARVAIGVGASAGGVEALTRVVGRLPPDLDACVLVVLHLQPNGPSMLPQILARDSALTVVQAEDGDVPAARRVLIAPPDRHVVVEAGRIRLLDGPRENGARPAVDPMLRSIAAEYGPAAIAVVLSGALGDGALGAGAVADAGGLVIVQDPRDAAVRSMPERALEVVSGATVLEAPRIASELVGRVQTLLHPEPA